MAYIVGYAPNRNKGKVSEAAAQNAREALKLVEDLQRSDETIRFIRAPWGGEIGIGELKMYAEEETKT